MQHGFSSIKMHKMWENNILNLGSGNRLQVSQQQQQQHSSNWKNRLHVCYSEDSVALSLFLQDNFKNIESVHCVCVCSHILEAEGWGRNHHSCTAGWEGILNPAWEKSAEGCAWADTYASIAVNYIHINVSFFLIQLKVSEFDEEAAWCKCL